jgi:hypothetical protein
MIDRCVLLFLERRLYHILTRLQMLLQTIKEWPREIYDIPAVIVAIRAELDKSASTSTSISSAPSAVVLMECLAELYVPLILVPDLLLDFMSPIKIHGESSTRQSTPILPPPPTTERV